MMGLIKKILMILGVVFVIGTLVFAVQRTPQDLADIELAGNDKDGEKNVAQEYKISAIDIPEDLNFAGENVPQEDPEIMERVDREFLVNTYWQSECFSC